MSDPSPIRVGLEVGKVAGISDGIGRYARGLLRALRKLGDECDPILYDLSDDRLGDRPAFELLTANRVETRPQSVGLDVFHSTGFALPPPGPVPLVLTLHDLTFLTHPQFHTDTNWARAAAATVGAAARRTRIIAVSEHTRQEVVELLGVPPERISVVHEAPDPVFTSEGSTPAGSLRLGRLPDRYVLAVGSLEPRKNLVGLLDGMMLLPSAVRRELALVVVGPGGWRNRPILERLRTARRRLRVHEMGYVSTEELVELYRRATVFAYPSLAEGFGLPVLEAMACGVPVLASNRTSLPEVAGDGAVLVDPEDPAAIAAGLQRLVEDDRLRADIVRRGFDNLRRFSWDRCARETVAVYRRAVEEER